MVGLKAVVVHIRNSAKQDGSDSSCNLVFLNAAELAGGFKSQQRVTIRKE